MYKKYKYTELLVRNNDYWLARGLGEFEGLDKEF